MDTDNVTSKNEEPQGRVKVGKLDEPVKELDEEEAKRGRACPGRVTN